MSISGPLGRRDEGVARAWAWAAAEETKGASTEALFRRAPRVGTCPATSSTMTPAPSTTRNDHLLLLTPLGSPAWTPSSRPPRTPTLVRPALRAASRTELSADGASPPAVVSSYLPQEPFKPLKGACCRCCCSCRRVSWLTSELVPSLVGRLRAAPAGVSPSIDPAARRRCSRCSPAAASSLAVPDAAASMLTRPTRAASPRCTSARTSIPTCTSA